MSIKSTFVWTALNTFTKVLSGIVINKIIALLFGPSGLALIGQFQNLSGLAIGFSNSSIQTGIVKETASSSCLENQKVVRANSLFITLTSSFIFSFIIFFQAEWISNYFFNNTNYIRTIEFFSFSIVFSALNLNFIAILNGNSRIKLLSFVGFLTSAFSVIVVYLTSLWGDIALVMLSFSVSQIVVFFLLLFMSRYLKIRFIHFNLSLFDKSVTRRLLRYGVNSFLSGFILSISLLLVRNEIIASQGLDDAGYWEALYRMAIYFNMAFMLPISIYYLPRFSSEKSYLLIKRQLTDLSLKIVAIMMVVILVVNYFRDFAVLTIFSADFMLITDFIAIMLVAEVFRVLAGFVSSFLISKYKLNIVIFNEAIWASAFVCSVILLVPDFGLEGVVYSYFLASLIWVISSWVCSLRVFKANIEST